MVAGIGVEAIRLGGSALISALVAVGTVVLTFKLNSRRDRIKGLDGLESEMALNQEIAETHIQELLENLGHRQIQVEKYTPLLELETTAFEAVKNQGLLMRYSSEVQRKITGHYQMVERVNKTIQRREEATAGIGPKDQSTPHEQYTQMMMAWEDQTVSMLLELTGLDALSVNVADIEHEPLRLRLENVDPDKEPVYGFDKVRRTVQHEKSLH